MEALTPWTFDATVADGFVPYARRHIPGYDRVVDLSLLAASAFCAPGERIAEVGCATGHTIQRLEAAGFRDIVGVDASREMLASCAVRYATLVHSSEFPSGHGPFKLVLSNWTLHFVPPAERRGYLASIRDALAPCGKLLITDKTLQSNFGEHRYHDFKRTRGVPEEEIREKKRRLVGVLEPLPPAWYFESFDALGLRSEILWAEHGFVTFFASLP